MSQAVAQYGATEGYGGVGAKAPKQCGSGWFGGSSPRLR